MTIPGEHETDKIEQVDRGDRTSESISEDSLIDGDRQEHQRLHQEMEKSGRKFNTFSDNDDDQSFQAMKPSETLEEYQARLAQKNEQESILPRVDSFGIDFGDGFTETAKGKVSMPDAQKFIDANSQNAITTTQNFDQQPRYKQDQLIAANESPSDSIRQSASLPATQEVHARELPDDALAQLPDLGKIIRDTGKAIVNPHSGDMDKFLDKEAAELATNKFPRLAWYSRSYASIGPNLLLGIVRNETEHYKRVVDDAAQDGMVAIGQKAWLSADPTTGPAQVSKSNQKRLAEIYPDLLGKPEDYPRASLSPFFATLLVGAYLDNAIETFERWDTKQPDKEELKDFNVRLLFEHAYPSWKEGHYTEALIRSYNPGRGSTHVKNVRRHIDALTGKN